MIIHQVFGFRFLCYFSCFFFLHQSITCERWWFLRISRSHRIPLVEDSHSYNSASALPHCINVLTFPMLCVCTKNYSNSNNSTCIDNSSWASDYFVVSNTRLVTWLIMHSLAVLHYKIPHIACTVWKLKFSMPFLTGLQMQNKRELGMSSHSRMACLVPVHSNILTYWWHHLVYSLCASRFKHSLCYMPTACMAKGKSNLFIKLPLGNV